MCVWHSCEVCAPWRCSASAELQFRLHTGPHTQFVKWAACFAVCTWFRRFYCDFAFESVNAFIFTWIMQGILLCLLYKTNYKIYYVKWNVLHWMVNSSGHGGQMECSRTRAHLLACAIYLFFLLFDVRTERTRRAFNFAFRENVEDRTRVPEAHTHTHLGCRNNNMHFYQKNAIDFAERELNRTECHSTCNVRNRESMGRRNYDFSLCCFDISRTKLEVFVSLTVKVCLVLSGFVGRSVGAILLSENWSNRTEPHTACVPAVGLWRRACAPRRT